MLYDVRVTRKTALRVLAAAAAGIALQAGAQSFPEKPIRLLVGFPAGGGTDLVARFLGQRMGDALGQAVVIDNRAGASGTIAASAVAQAPPDGYTLFFASSGHAGNGALYTRLNYDTVKSFAPVGLAGTSAVVISVGGNSRFRSLPDLVRAAREQPGKLNYGAGGGGATLTNLAFEEMKHKLGIDVTTVPYKGIAPVQIATMSGEVDFTFDTVAGGAALIRSGRMRALAVTSAARSQVLPDVPTVAEQLLPGFDYVGWYALLAPAKTPAPVVAKLNEALNKVLSDPSVRARMVELGAEPATSTPAQLGELLARETIKWESAIRRLGLKLD